MGGIIMGLGAKGVSNHLIGAMAGRNMSITVSCQEMQTTELQCLPPRPRRRQRTVPCQECVKRQSNKKVKIKYKWKCLV